MVNMPCANFRNNKTSGILIQTYVKESTFCFVGFFDDRLGYLIHVHVWSVS